MGGHIDLLRVRAWPMGCGVNLPQEYLDRVVSDISRAVPTDSVYIFGSYARGEETPDSDLDLYVITSDDQEKSFEYGRRVRLALPWINSWSEGSLPKGKDIVCGSRASFRRRSNDLSAIEHIVAREGVKIYG